MKIKLTFSSTLGPVRGLSICIFLSEIRRIIFIVEVSWCEMVSRVTLKHRRMRARRIDQFGSIILSRTFSFILPASGLEPQSGRPWNTS